MTVVQPQLGLAVDEDAETRLAIVDDLDDTMFVEAGAGSGKTKSLVDRVTALVDPRRRADARDRGRHLHREGGGRAPRPHPPRARAGRDQLAARRRRRRVARAGRARRARRRRRSRRCTPSRSGCSRRTRSRPACRPGLEVLDEIGSQVAFDDRWTRFVDRLLDDPDARARSLLLRDVAGAALAVLRDLAVACNDNWDLVAERMRPEPDPPPVDVTGFLAELRSGVRAPSSECPTPTTGWRPTRTLWSVHLGRPLAHRDRRVRTAAPCSPTVSRSRRSR